MQVIFLSNSFQATSISLTKVVKKLDEFVSRHTLMIRGFLKTFDPAFLFTNSVQMELYSFRTCKYKRIYLVFCKGRRLLFLSFARASGVSSKRCYTEVRTVGVCVGAAGIFAMRQR